MPLFHLAHNRHGMNVELTHGLRRSLPGPPRSFAVHPLFPQAVERVYSLTAHDLTSWAFFFLSLKFSYFPHRCSIYESRRLGRQEGLVERALDLGQEPCVLLPARPLTSWDSGQVAPLLWDPVPHL